MQAEWDEEKCRANLEKHGLSFEDAWQVLAGDTITIPDERYDYGEDRLITLGRLGGPGSGCGACRQGENTRIISMRKANAREARNLSKAT